MKDVKDGDTIWVLKFHGPAKCTFRMEWPEKKKVLIENGDVPEIVEATDCYNTQQECYSAAASKASNEALFSMKKAADYATIAANPKS